MRHLLQWLYPGLAVKRWMLLFSLGILLLVFGATLILNYQIFGILEEEMLRFAFQMTGSYSYTFLAVCGTLMIILALWIMTHAVRRLVKRFFELMAPGQTEVSKSILSRMELSRGMKIVSIGGGHGLSMLLRGLKTKTSNITAIVTVADDGGSSGRLREEMGIIAPGDLRNCLVALADKETVLEQLFQYRFAGNGELSGASGISSSRRSSRNSAIRRTHSRQRARSSISAARSSRPPRRRCVSKRKCPMERS